MNYFIKRLFYFIPVSAAVILLVGMMIHAIPGDPVDQIAGDFASENDKMIIRKKLGLDQPFSTQILEPYQKLLQGDLGRSLITGRPVTELIRERALPSLELAVFSLLFSCLISIPAGAFSAVRPRSPINSAFTGIAFLGASLPNFWLGPILILIFSIHLGWFPVSGRTHLSSVILPVLALSSSLSAILMRMTRTSFLSQIYEEYVRTARSKGVSEFSIFFKHILKNASLTLITIVSSQFGALVTGTLITEKVFDWPGLGTLVSEAIELRDYPVIQGCVFLFSFTFLVTNLVTDLIYSRLDPRIRLDLPSGAGKI